MTNKDHEDDNYDLPPGLILPKDDSPDYPNWKKGILCGIIGGFFGGLAFWILLMSEILGAQIGYSIPILGFFAFFIMAGSIAAFRPPHN